jgi:hypothetical protein
MPRTIGNPTSFHQRFMGGGCPAPRALSPRFVSASCRVVHVVDRPVRRTAVGSVRTTTVGHQRASPLRQWSRLPSTRLPAAASPCSARTDVPVLGVAGRSVDSDRSAVWAASALVRCGRRVRRFLQVRLFAIPECPRIDRRHDLSGASTWTPSRERGSCGQRRETLTVTLRRGSTTVPRPGQSGRCRQISHQLPGGARVLSGERVFTGWLRPRDPRGHNGEIAAASRAVSSVQVRTSSTRKIE